MEFRTPQVYMEFTGSDADDIGTTLVNDALSTVVTERLLTFEFSDHAEKIDELKLGLANDDRYLTDSGLFVMGNAVIVSWGWPGQLSDPRRMIVCKREQTNPYIVILRDPMVLLNQDKRTRQMKNVTDSEWVRKVAASYGYTGAAAQIADTKVRHDITQPGKRTDAMQIAEMARKNGFICFIGSDGLYWGPRVNDANPIRTYHFRTGEDLGVILGEPTIEQFTDRAYSQVTVTGRDPTTKRTFQIEVSSATMLGTSLGQETEIGDPKETAAESKRQKRAKKIEVRPSGFLTEEEAKVLANSIFRDNAQGMYQMSMTVMGDGWLPGKAIVELVGHSAAYDGHYYVREAIHRVTPGTYTMDLKCERDALSEVNIAQKVRRKNPKPPTPKTAAGETTAEAATAVPEAKRTVILKTDAQGQPSVALSYVVDGGESGNSQTSYLTPTDIQNLDSNSLRILTEKGAQSRLPEL